MTGDDVFEDIRRQQEELEEKERAAAERKAALARKRATNRGKTAVITSQSRPSTSGIRTRGTKGRQPVEDSSSEEEQSLCITCSANYFSENARMRAKWAGCDTCDTWFCGDCLPENFDYNATFKCDNC